MATTTLTSQKETRDVVRDLIRYIQTGGLSVGDRLPPIRQLAAQFQSSTSVIRDAMMQVQTIGLIKILPRSGAFIQSLDYAPMVSALADTIDGALVQTDHNLFHLLETRQLLEVDCAAQAARRRRLEDLLPIREALEQMDEALAQMHTAQSDEARLQFVEADIRFHLGIAQVAGNPVLATMLRAILGLIRPHLAQIPWTAERKQLTRQAHIELYDALLEGNADEAGARMRQHLKLAYDGLLKRIWSIPQYESPESDKGNGTVRHDVL